MSRLKDISVRFKIVIPVTVVVIATSIVTCLVIYQLLARSEEERAKKAIHPVQSRLEETIKELDSISTLITSNIAGNGEIQFGVALGDASILKKLSEPLIKTLKGSETLKGHITFIDSRGKVIYSDLPQLVGKVILDTRPMLKALIKTKDKRPLSGIEPGVDGVFFRKLVPIIYNGMYSGAVEYSISLLNLFNRVKGVDEHIHIAWFAKGTSLPGTRGNFEGFRLGDATSPSLFESLAVAPALKGALKRLSGQPVTEHYKNFYVCAIPMHFFDAHGNEGAFVILLDNTQGINSMRLVLKSLVVIFAISALVLIGVVLLTVNLVLRPLPDLVNFMDDLAAGRLLREARLWSGDEIGRLARRANTVLREIGSFIFRLKGDSKKLNHATGELLQASNTVMNDSMELEGVSNDVMHGSENASKSIENVVNAMDELTLAAEEISKNVAKTASISNEAKERAEVTNEVISRLGESSKNIGEVTQVIQSIAEQTNLLALNATIEAARAGEAGKGFAVVANEVKELAKQTAAATDEITKMIQTIQSDTDEAVKSVRSITEVIGTITDLANNIAGATEEQTATIGAVGDSIATANEQVLKVKTRAGDLSSQVNDFASVVDTISKVKDEIVDISKGIEELLKRYQVDESILSPTNRGTT